MKIIKLQSENYKRIIAVEIAPDGNLVEITGKNGNGKTSVLDSIWVALGGLDAAAKQPIRKGELEARIVLHLGNEKPELIVTRVFKPSKDQSQITSSLKVESAEGAKYSSPQTMLDKLLGALAFDPLEFDRMDARAQFNTLRGFVPDVDFEAIDNAQRGDYDRRATFNRKAKECLNAAQLITVPPDLPQDKIDVSALAQKLDDAGRHNTDIETRKTNRERIFGEIKMHEGEIARLEKLVNDLNEQISNARAKMAGERKEADAKRERLAQAGALPEPIDTTDIRTQIASAEQINAAIDKRDTKVSLIAESEQHEQAATELSLSIDKREVDKREKIAAAKLPVDGISFGVNEVLLGGVPWGQASDAERLIASMQMAMAMNPKLRIIRVRDGSLLDDDSVKVVAEMAKASDYQVWMERVDSSGKVGVVIENGRVKQEATQ